MKIAGYCRHKPQQAQVKVENFKLLPDSLQNLISSCSSCEKTYPENLPKIHVGIWAVEHPQTLTLKTSSERCYCNSRQQILPKT